MRRVAAGAGLLVVVFMFLLVLMPLPVHAASTLVQQTGGRCTSCATLPVSLTATSGDVVVVTMLVDPSLTSIADSLSSSFTPALSPFLCDGGSTICYIYSATLSSSGADTITITIPGTHILIEAYAYEVSGVATPPIVTAVNTGSSASVSTASTSFQSGAFLLGTFVGFGTFTATSPFTLSPRGANLFLFEEYATSGVTSPTTFPATFAAVTGSWIDVGLVLDPALAPPIPEYPLGLPILAIFMIIGYGVIRRRTRNVHA